jgi:hypothetical protein
MIAPKEARSYFWDWEECDQRHSTDVIIMRWKGFYELFGWAGSATKKSSPEGDKETWLHRRVEMM